jgi:hypothetical protein
MHVIDDIRRKGATKNFSTRPGEGFQQEVRETYNQTNFRELQVQVSDSSFHAAHSYCYDIQDDKN